MQHADVRRRLKAHFQQNSSIWQEYHTVNSIQKWTNDTPSRVGVIDLLLTLITQHLQSSNVQMYFTLRVKGNNNLQMSLQYTNIYIKSAIILIANYLPTNDSSTTISPQMSNHYQLSMNITQHPPCLHNIMHMSISRPLTFCVLSDSSLSQVLWMWAQPFHFTRNCRSTCSGSVASYSLFGSPFCSTS